MISTNAAQTTIQKILLTAKSGKWIEFKNIYFEVKLKIKHD